MITTRFTQLLGVDHPVASAGMGGVKRTPFVERWLGREPELRRRRSTLRDEVAHFQESNADDGLMWFGQSAGLIDSIEPAGDLVREIVAEAEQILRSRLPTFL